MSHQRSISPSPPIGADHATDSALGTLERVAGAISLLARRQLRDGATMCPGCGARHGGERCHICNGGGKVPFAGETLPPDRLRAKAKDLAERGDLPREGFVWLVSHFPSLSLLECADVQEMVRVEIERFPTRALLGFAPDALVEAGCGDMVAEAARRQLLAARASLRAQAALQKYCRQR